jgi:hypothetical protein
VFDPAHSDLFEATSPGLPESKAIILQPIKVLRHNGMFVRGIVRRMILAANVGYERLAPETIHTV